jgi:hypothetical protein
MVFPLYDIFSREALGMTAESLTQDERKTLIAEIKTLNQTGLDNLYLIIRYSATLDNDQNVYNAKYNRKNVVFDLNTMSDHLQKVIFMFVKKHIEEVQTSSSSEVDIVFE